jgi:hypothetical protein
VVFLCAYHSKTVKGIVSNRARGYRLMSVATRAATFQAAWNRDELYRVGPFAEPVPVLEKEAK